MEQAEAVFVSSMLKSIVMSEIEEENPRFIQYITSFKVKRNELYKPQFYALRAFEDNGKPLDYLVGKKQAVNILKDVSLAAKSHFYECQRFINMQRFEIIETTALFEHPLAEETARIFLVHESMKKHDLKDLEGVITAIEKYPLKNLIFIDAYKALADSFNLQILHRW